MRLNFESEEVENDYPKNWNILYRYHWTETEELMIERAREKILNTLKNQKMMPRERWTKTLFTDDPYDQVLGQASSAGGLVNPIFESFATPYPPAISYRDLLDFPNLDFLARMYHMVKFPADDFFFTPSSFGEEVLSRKFRSIAHGPPLVVEPFAKNKEDLEWLMDNLPDPNLRGLRPSYNWMCTEGKKIMGDVLPITMSTCAGAITTACFIRGVNEFLLDLRTNPEVAELALEIATIYQNKKIDSATKILEQSIGADGKGNRLMWCDSAAYMTLDEFKQTLPLHYGDSIPYAARKGFAPYIAPVAPPEYMNEVARILEENKGGAVSCMQEHPPIEQGYPVAIKYSKVYAITATNTKIILNGLVEKIRDELIRMAKVFGKYQTKGHRTNAGVIGDAMTPLENLEVAYRLRNEELTYEKICSYPLGS